MGIQAYWTDGAQMVAPHDLNVMNEVQSITSIDDVQFDGKEALIETIGEDIDEVYLEEVKEDIAFS